MESSTHTDTHERANIGRIAHLMRSQLSLCVFRIVRSLTHWRMLGYDILSHSVNCVFKQLRANSAGKEPYIAEEIIVGRATR